jgi:hypothetical protein
LDWEGGMQRFSAALAAWIALGMVGLAHAQEPAVRRALVIGVSDYNLDGRRDTSREGADASVAAGFAPDLRNTFNDAADIRDALVSLGFDVDFRIDTDIVALRAAIATFHEKVRGAPADAQSVIYYAGHAVQIDGVNYLIPAGARVPDATLSSLPPSDAEAVLYRAFVPASELLDAFPRLNANGVNILVLDACRDNPWSLRGLGQGGARTRGLVNMAAPPRTVLAFSTSPNTTAMDGDGASVNSPFASALRTWIVIPGNTIVELFDEIGKDVLSATQQRQTPWVQTPPIGDICLAGCRRASAALAAGQVRLDFSAAENAEPPRYVVSAEPYLRRGAVRVTIPEYTPQNSVIVFQNNRGAYAGRALDVTVSENFLTQIQTDNTPASFTMAFSRPLNRFTFLVPALWPKTESGVTFPEWRITALDAKGVALDVRSDELRGSFVDAAAQRHTLTAPPASSGIAAVRVESYSHRFAAFETIMIEEIILEPR